MTNPTIQMEFIGLVREEVEPLFYSHWSEVEFFKELPLDIDWEMLQSMENNGSLYTFVARLDGKLVGYLITSKTYHPNYKGKLFASDLGFFVDTNYRRYNIGSKLLSFAEKVFIEDGVVGFNITTKTDHPIDPLMIRKGFKQEEKVFTKILYKEG